jgi:hypothetical protein
MRTLTLRELNRATLQRQLLLQRHTLTPPEATERLMGLQAQLNNPPYLGLWTRLHLFQKDMLTQAMQNRQIVRAPLLRSTLHLFSADDYVRFRTTIQPALSKGFRSFFGTRMANLPLETLLEVAKEALQTRALSTGDFKALLLQVAPDADPGAWKTERVKKDLTLTLEPFFGVSSAIKDELINEAEVLVRFIDDTATTHRVVWRPL